MIGSEGGWERLVVADGKRRLASGGSRLGRRGVLGSTVDVVVVGVVSGGGG